MARSFRVSAKTRRSSVRERFVVNLTGPQVVALTLPSPKVRSNTTNWIQYYSVRKTARQCGVISLTEHFDAWKGLGMNLGNLLEAKILVEVGGGVGKVDLPVANVIESQ